jgi:hypothetical protein
MATIFDAHRAAAVQDLNARVAHADGVRVVAMLLVGLAGVPGTTRRRRPLGAPDLARDRALHNRSRPLPADLLCLRGIVRVTRWR